MSLASTALADQTIGPRETLIEWNGPAPQGLASDGTSLFVASADAIYRVEGAGPPKRLFHFSRKTRFVIDSDFDPWVEGESLYFASERALWRLPKAGGKPAQIAKLPGCVRIAGTDKAFLYYTAVSGKIGSPKHELRRVGKDGKGETTLRSLDEWGEAVGIDESWIYFLSIPRGMGWRGAIRRFAMPLIRVPREGGRPENFPSPSQQTIAAAAVVEGATVYYLEMSGAVMGIRGASGPSIRLATVKGPCEAGALASDSRYLYAYCEQLEGGGTPSIHRIEK